MKDVAKIDTKEITKAFKSLNESGLLESKIKAGKVKEENIKLFTETFEKLDDGGKGEELLEKAKDAVEFYNDLYADEAVSESKEPVEPEAEQKNSKSEPEDKKVEKTKKKKKESTGEKKPSGRQSLPDDHPKVLVRKVVEPMIEKGTYTSKQIKEEMLKKYPEIGSIFAAVFLSCIKNPRYVKRYAGNERLVGINDKGCMFYLDSKKK